MNHDAFLLFTNQWKHTLNSLGSKTLYAWFTRKVRPQLGRILQDRIMVEEGYLPPRDAGRAKTAASMEHGAPTKILFSPQMHGNKRSLFKNG